MYQIQREDSNDSTNSSFWSDKESDKQEDEIENGFKQKGTIMKSIPGAMEEGKVGLSKDVDKDSSSEEMIERFVEKEDHNGSTSPENASKETLDGKNMEKQDQNLGKSLENSDFSDSKEGREDMDSKMVDKDSNDGGHSSEIEETSADDGDEEDIDNARKAPKSETSTGESSKNERKKWKDLSDDSSLNAETTSEDDEARVKFKFSSNKSGVSSSSSGENGKLSSGNDDKGEVSPDRETGISQEELKAAKSDEDICKDGEIFERSSYFAGESMGIEEATIMSSKSVQNFKTQNEREEENGRMSDESEFSHENASSSSDDVKSSTDNEGEVVAKTQEDGYTFTKTSSSTDDVQSSSENGQNSENQERQPTSGEEHTEAMEGQELKNVSDFSDNSSTARTNSNDNLFEHLEKDANVKLARNFSQESGQNGKKQPTSGEEETRMESLEGQKLKNVCDERDVVQSSSENYQNKELATKTKKSDHVQMRNNEGGSETNYENSRNRQRLKKQRNFYDDSSTNRETSSSERNTENSVTSSCEEDSQKAGIQSKQSEPATKLLKSSSENSKASSSDKNDILTKDEMAKSSSDNEKTNNHVTQDSFERCSENKLGFQVEEMTVQSEKRDDFWDNHSDIASPSTDRNENEFGINEDIQDGGDKNVKMQSNEDEKHKMFRDFTEGKTESVSEGDNECSTSDGFEKNIKTEGGNENSSEEEKKTRQSAASTDDDDGFGDNSDQQVETMSVKHKRDCNIDQKADKVGHFGEEDGKRLEDVSQSCTETELVATSEEERVGESENILENSKNIDPFEKLFKSSNVVDENFKQDQNERTDCVEESPKNVSTSGNEDEVTIQENAQNSSPVDSEEIERWFEGETFTANETEMIQANNLERHDLDQINVDDEASTSLSPATSLLTSGYGTYLSEKQDGGHGVEDDRLTIIEFDKDSLYSFGVCEQEESHTLPIINKSVQEKEDIEGEIEAEDEFWDGMKSENGSECEQDGKVEAEVCLERCEDDEDSSNTDIKFIDSEVDLSGESHRRMCEEWEGNLRPPFEGASCLEDRLADLHLSTSVQHESENDDLTSHSESPSSESLSEGAFESYIRGMSRSQSDGDIRPKPKSFIRPVLGPTGPKKTDPVAKYFQYKQLWDMFKLPGENDRKALRWEIKERLAYQPPPPKPRKVLVPNTYTVPTEKKRSSLRWEIRNDLAAGNLPHSYNYRF